MTKNMKIPWITAGQMIEVDRLMIEEYGIGLIQMMENAGRLLARLGIDRFLDGDPSGKKLAILAGSGGNGGGALVAARNLHNWGANLQVFLTKPSEKLSDVTRIQAGILERMEVELNLYPEETGTEFDLIIDGVIGYSLLGPLRGRARDLISWANQTAAPILSLDLPSGLDATTGEFFNPSICADATLTLALPKAGLRSAAPARTGELYLGDIGVPPSLYHELELEVGPIFAEEETIRLI